MSETTSHGVCYIAQNNAIRDVTVDTQLKVDLPI